VTSLRQDLHFRRYWLARMVSLSGSMITYVVLPILVYQLTGSNLWTGLVAVSEALPYVCFGLVAGALADRLDRRRLMVAMDLASAAVLASLPLAYLAGVLTAPHVLVAGFVVQAFFVFFDAANFGALPALVGRDRLGAANSAVIGGGTVIELAVPALVGVLLVLLAPAPLLALDALSFIASALLLRAITAPMGLGRSGDRAPLVSEIREGLSFLVNHPLLRVLTVLGVLVNIGIAAFLSQLVPWLDQVLRIAPAEDPRLGAVWAVLGAGGLAGSLLYPRITRRLGETQVAQVFMPASLVCVVACALLDQWLLAAVAVGLWYLTFIVVALTTITLRQQITPDHLQGRVNTVGRMLAFGAGWPVGALAAGLLSEAYGPRAALWLAAAMVAVACVVAWAALPRAAPASPDGWRAVGSPELGARAPASEWLTDRPEGAGEERAWPDESRR